MNKLAVFFPGIGYTVDKPLMYYSRKIVKKLGYEIRLLEYTGFPNKVRGDRKKMIESYEIALAQSRQMLADVDLTKYDEVLFVGKSVGTIVAAQTAAESGAEVRQIFYTPLEETFLFPAKQAVVFTGSADPWVGKENSRIPALSGEKSYPCFIIPDADHSLECGDIRKDIDSLQTIMQETMRFITGSAQAGD